MADKKTNADAVKDYHKKLVNLAIVRVPATHVDDDKVKSIYKDSVVAYLNERYAGQKSMNEYLLELIEQDMNTWYESQSRTERITFAKGVKDFKSITDAC